MKKTITLQLQLICLLASLLASPATAADLYLGGGAKAGEITDRTAIVLARLTSTQGKNAQGLIPGRDGQARLRYGTPPVAAGSSA